MPDWSKLVRERLPALHVRPERENEIVAELALQLEQAYADAIAGGAGEEEARRRALAQMGDWDKLGRGVDVPERRAGFTAGRDARSALRTPLLPAEPGVHGDRDVDAGLRHWRQHGHLHDGGRAGIAWDALSGAGAADVDRDAEGAAAGNRTLDFGAGLLRYSGTVAGVFLDGRHQPRVECGHDGTRAGGATGRALRFGGILSDARRQRGTGAHVHAGGRPQDDSLPMWWCCRMGSGSGDSAEAAT